MTWIDPTKLGDWYEAFSPSLSLYARQWVDAVAADDVVQDAFVQLMRQRSEPVHVKAWLFRVVRNGAISRTRSRRRRRRYELAVGQAGAAPFESRPDDLIDARLAASLLGELDGEQREAIVLRVWGGLSFDDVAATMGVSKATAFRRYEAGLNALRKRLETSCKTNTPTDSTSTRR